MSYLARPYIAGSPQAEVIGQAVIAFSENLESHRIKPLLPVYGLDNARPDVWYPHQSWFNVLRDLEKDLKEQATTTFVAFGLQVVSTAVLPPSIRTVPEALQALPAIHHMNVRNIPREEGYTLECRGKGDMVVYHNTPNPDDAIYGFLWGIAARFKHPSEHFVVRRLRVNPRPDICRSAFEVKWGSNPNL